jgi:hypothetical protein
MSYVNIINQGTSKTLIRDNNDNQTHIKSSNWNMDYNGDVANIHINNNNDGKMDIYDISLDNNGLENILNMKSVNMPIDKRLMRDFMIQRKTLKTLKKLKTAKNNKKRKPNKSRRIRNKIQLI